MLYPTFVFMALLLLFYLLFTYFPSDQAFTPSLHFGCLVIIANYGFRSGQGFKAMVHWKRRLDGTSRGDWVVNSGESNG